jgi:tetratricopeptide (TPR) repeat protein/transcriptional regulator with XRE-family HTH domain
MSGSPEQGFGDLLRQSRKNALLTQEELARRARLGVRTIQDLERGVNQTARPATAWRLADGLGLTSPVRERFLRAASGQGMAAPILAQAAGPGVRYSLPPDTAAFTGREPELGRITATVAGASTADAVVAIHAICGMPGVGKTALAVRAAHLLRHRFPDRQMFIDLHGHTPGREPVRPQDALAGLLAATGIDPRYLPAGLDGRTGMWRDRMAGQQALLVLDNATSSGQVAPLLPGAGGCLVLVTSRRHLGDLPGTVIPVPVDTLPPGVAQEMFWRLAPGAGPSTTVAELVRLAGYLPLAISLLARVYARHPSWTLADLLAETQKNMLTLSAENKSIAAAFEVSYRYLDSSRQQFLRRLGLHLGPAFDVYAAAALTDTTLDEASEHLDALHREGLLTEVSYHRYGMHDLIRRYASERVTTDPVDDRRQALDRQLDFYTHTATIAEAHLARQTRPGAASALLTPPAATPVLRTSAEALSWVRSERANLLACLDHVTGTGQHVRVVDLTAALAALLRRDGPWPEAITRHGTAVRAARQAGDLRSQASALDDLAAVWLLTGTYAAATQALDEALAIYRDLGDRGGEANALRDAAIVKQLTGDYPAAARGLEEALSIFHDLGDRRGQANALCDLGIIRRHTGDYPGAAQAQQEALSIFHDLGDRCGQANALDNLASVLLQTGDYPGAAQALETALRILRDLGHQRGKAHVLNKMGELRRQTGDYPGAIQALEAALRIFRDLGDPLGQCSAFCYLGTVRRQTGDYPGAIQALETALRISRDIGDRGCEAQALNEMGTLHCVSGDLSRAEEYHRQALNLAREIGSSWDKAHALAGLGRCARTAGQTLHAEAVLRQAEKIFHQLGTTEAPEIAVELNALAREGALVRTLSPGAM